MTNFCNFHEEIYVMTWMDADGTRHEQIFLTFENAKALLLEKIEAKVECKLFLHQKVTIQSQIF